LAKITVVGSSNTDMVVMTPRIPSPGETVIGGEFVMVGGGKGANQAVAAARLGAEVTFVARVGSDVFGSRAVEDFRREGIKTEFIGVDEGARSGVALIFVDEKGENVIVVAPGANGRLAPEHIEQARCPIEQSDVLIVQLEVPVETVAAAAEIAHRGATKVILNPAPAQDLPKSLLAMVDVLTPNETEAARLVGLESLDGTDPEEVGRELLAMGVGAVVMTLGSQGALIVTADEMSRVEAPKVDPVDTTAAGDAFSGALGVALAEGKSLKAAAEFATRVAAISVTRLGAQPSLPTRAEVDSFADDKC
jgi:ribokinase